MRRRSRISPPRKPLEEYPPALRREIAALRYHQDKIEESCIQQERTILAHAMHLAPLAALAKARLKRHRNP